MSNRENNMSAPIINAAARELAVEAATRAGWEICFIQGPGDIGRGASLCRFHQAPSGLTQDQTREGQLVWGVTDEMACARVLEFLNGQQAGSSEWHCQAMESYIQARMDAVAGCA